MVPSAEIGDSPRFAPCFAETGGNCWKLGGWKLGTVPDSNAPAKAGTDPDAALEKENLVKAPRWKGDGEIGDCPRFFPDLAFESGWKLGAPGNLEKAGRKRGQTPTKNLEWILLCPKLGSYFVFNLKKSSRVFPVPMLWTDPGHPPMVEFEDLDAWTSMQF